MRRLNINTGCVFNVKTGASCTGNEGRAATAPAITIISTAIIILTLTQHAIVMFKCRRNAHDHDK